MDCNGCTKCCRWKGDTKLQPKGIKANKHGDCVHVRSYGCHIHDSPDFPEQCKHFSCVDLAMAIKQDCFMNVLIEGLRRTDDET